MINCTVIVPVGPGHEEIATSAHNSIEEAVFKPGAFDEIFVIYADDTKGDKGRSKTRNLCVKEQQEWMIVAGTALEGENVEKKAFETDWLFFLDADDLMLPECFESASPYIKDYDCIFGQIYELQDDKVLRRGQVAEINSYQEYLSYHPFLTVQMGHFVRRSKFPGFDEELDCCEDVDLYIKEWRDLRCIKIDKPLFLNRRGHHSWTQDTDSEKPRMNGREWSIKAGEMIKEARKCVT